MRQEIGLIADTHGLLRPEAVAALRGVDRILHAGDVGRISVLEELEKLAPVTAVRGNVDNGGWAERLPMTAEIELGPVWIYMIHIVDDLDLDLVAAGFSVLVYGHSHRAVIERRGGLLRVNPGSAGPRRFDLPVTVARLTIDSRGPAAQRIDLPLC